MTFLPHYQNPPVRAYQRLGVIRYGSMLLPSSGILTTSVGSTSVERPWWSRWIDWVVEARSHRVICLVIGIWVLNGFDLAFTILSHNLGMLSEENPVARVMLGYGTPSIILFKIGLVLIGSYPLLRFRTARITEMGAFVILIAYAALGVHWKECYDLYAFTAMHNFELAQGRDLTIITPQ